LDRRFNIPRFPLAKEWAESDCPTSAGKNRKIRLFLKLTIYI
jgi:hypothetical protein